MIDKTAIVDSNARVSKNVIIGPYSVIGPNVEIGEGTVVQSHVNITGKTIIGKNNYIYPFASIGNDPQDLKFKGEKTLLEIGDNNKIREYVTINPGTEGGGGKTKVGNNCLFMVSSHIAHDCIVGDNVILANNVPLGGHAHVDDNAIIGGNSAVQQFTRIGKFAMIGGMCGVVRDVIPYGIAHGNRSILQGLNLIGLRRKNIPNKEILSLSEAYKIIFKNENLTENLSSLSDEFRKNKLVSEVVNFIEKDKKRPICTPFSK
ncbi:acyl-ACP--UDP-N-acetylglucosamine O-acyltransferase [Candidatus Pelagibacter communis]|uniref:acyl-ACP--UDP-N-acetylglucosamine O-acyltransferase n=1 Tax=Pelagibacter ubique TaxID=198252 RepID=UPI00094C8F0D|nr:acyl-ACP--UDP-N-acetylglucosamine O-acyltransferase [Candidatus Pelagibacter ubique]